MTLSQEIALAVVLAVGAAALIEYIRSKNAGNSANNGGNGNNAGNGDKGFTFTVKFNKKT